MFVATITVPRYSEQGTWTLSGNIAIGDNALNWNTDQSHRPTFEVIRTETSR